MPNYIIDNKKINLTNEEWQLYQKIVKSYNNGENLFIDLFETDDTGTITILKPPSRRQTSMEVFLFLITIANHQSIRLMQDEVADIVGQMKAKLKEVDELLQKLKG